MMRFLWRLIPAPIRYSLYRAATHSNSWLGLVIRKVIAIFRVVTLWNFRAHATALWPEAGGFDHLALTLWGAGLRYHAEMLDFTWRHGHRVRAWRSPLAPERRVKIVHATGSFDLGGTQTQIKFLCTSGAATLEHVATEIFPEMNYLYRQGVTIAPGDYTGRGLLGRTGGRLISNMGYRSSQLIQIYKLVCDFRRERPAVVVGWGHEMCATTFLAAAVARVPRIVFCIRTVNPTYGWVPTAFAGMLRRAHKSMTPFVDLVAVNSTLLRDDHAAWVGMNPAEIAVCANGIDIAPVAPAAVAEARSRIRRELGIAETTTVITNVGRFSDEKGQPWLVEANRMLLKRNLPGPFVWLLCGDGATLPAVRAQAEALGMNNMIFLGRTNAVRDILSASDIFVMPSDFEGMPNAMLEAMAAGLPCVSTNRSGAIDVARDGIEALYYEPRDAVTLAQHLDRLMRDPAAARALGAAAAARVTEFPVERFVHAFEAAVMRTMTAGPNQGA